MVVLVAVGVVLFVVARDDEPTATTLATTSPPTATRVTTTTQQDSKAEVIRRLREILQVRELAIRERDASLFDGIYTSDCSCLRAGREAVAALAREHVQWSERSISIDVKSTNSLSTRLWEVVAVFVSSPFRIETEEGKLVREAPAEHIRYRFLLVRTSDTEPWKLGRASTLEG